MRGTSRSTKGSGVGHIGHIVGHLRVHGVSLRADVDVGHANVAQPRKKGGSWMLSDLCTFVFRKARQHDCYVMMREI